MRTLAKYIYSIKAILGCKVEVQPIKTSKLVPQCKRCQAYGHTPKYCSKEPRCVKCTGKYLTPDCKKPAEEKSKCVHCGEAHPANYRGCIVAKEMQKLKNKSIKKPLANNLEQVAPKRPSTQDMREKTYAQVTAKTHYSKSDNSINQPHSNLDVKLDEIFKLMSSFDGRLQRREIGTKQSFTKKSDKK
ncbi:unnamed protein product [Danaus chrysippus]|uniref:(African queen) hypothetical protein n=1 Tax=Danaus chrysippus TaxID=151541 RepID=A0A8J2QD77_9NEOP|nr:unnamed protein product [Danaus chrysippus]